MVFKRSPSLTEQVKTHLKQRIINAEFVEGRIPSELKLANELSVSRNTVRDALSRLEMEGVVVRKQGAGTFVNEALLLVKTRLDEIVPYETMIREQGFSPAIKLIQVKEIAADDDLMLTLNLGLTDPVLHIEKLFLADERPVIFTDTYIPTAMITRPYRPADTLKPAYEFMPAYCQQELAYYLTEIVPVLASPQLTDRLRLPPHKTALLAFEEVGYNQDHAPIIRARSYFRNDLLRLRLMRRYIS